MKSRKEAEIEARRQLIVEAARRLLSTQDIEKTSMDEIAAAVDYTRRTLYAYFSSRDEILLAVLTEDLGTRWQTQQHAIGEVETGLEKLSVWGESLFAFSRAHPQAVRLQAYWDYRGIDRGTISPDVTRQFEEINIALADGLREIFSLGIADKSMRPGLNVDMCISQYLYSVRSVIHRALSPTYSFATFDPDEYVAHFLGIFNRALCQREAKA